MPAGIHQDWRTRSAQPLPYCSERSRHGQQGSTTCPRGKGEQEGAFPDCPGFGCHQEEPQRSNSVKSLAYTPCVNIVVERTESLLTWTHNVVEENRVKLNYIIIWCHFQTYLIEFPKTNKKKCSFCRQEGSMQLWVKLSLKATLREHQHCNHREDLLVLTLNELGDKTAYWFPHLQQCS